MKKCLTILSVSFLALAGTATAQSTKVKMCVQQDGKLAAVEANYNQETGAYTVIANDGREVSFDEAYPTDETYAAGSKWYINNEAVTVNGNQYVKYGLPRILGVNEVAPIGKNGKVPVYGEDPANSNPEVIYVPVRTGCEFQPYQMEAK